MLHEDFHLSDPELLSAADGELSSARQQQVRAHLQACWACRTRMTELENTIANFVTNYRSAFDGQLPPERSAAARFKAQLTQQTRRTTKQRSAGFSIAWLFPARWAALAPVLLCVLLLAGTFLTTKFFWRSSNRHTVSRLEAETVPNPHLTPGEAAFVSKTEVCSGTPQTEQRSIPEALRQAVLAEYGVKGVPQNSYEIDFLITPELGGSASIRNLWPQPYFSRTWNARVKDALEERLHNLVCSGEIDLPTAQREISSNWVDAYKKYVRTDNPM